MAKKTACTSNSSPDTPPCDACGSRCCRYVAIHLSTPRTNEDFDHLRFYLLHKNVNIFIDHDKDWYIEFVADCEKLHPTGLCMDYDNRPQLCRSHGNEAGDCEYYDQPFLHSFSTVEELAAWRQQEKQRRLRRRKRRRQSASRKKAR